MSTVLFLNPLFYGALLGYINRKTENKIQCFYILRTPHNQPLYQCPTTDWYICYAAYVDTSFLSEIYILHRLTADITYSIYFDKWTMTLTYCCNIMKDFFRVLKYMESTCPCFLSQLMTRTDLLTVLIDFAFQESYTVDKTTQYTVFPD